ncbi:MAG TPA: hypothetical protein VF587_19200 [Solirubrobacteraceae bacterium]|jgi:hypothetical protein
MAVVIMLLGASSADADIERISCHRGSADKCWSIEGYRAWIEIYGSTYPYTRYNVCAKAITAAGNYRTGSGCFVNSTYYGACLNGTSPLSRAYVYWAGTGSATWIDGEFRTPAHSGCAS